MRVSLGSEDAPETTAGYDNCISIYIVGTENSTYVYFCN